MTWRRCAAPYLAIPLMGAACGGAATTEAPPRSAESSTPDVVTVPEAPSPRGPGSSGEDPTLGAPPDDGKRSSEAAPTDARPLDGPFATLDDYRREHPPGHDASCGPLHEPSAPPRRFGGRGAIKEAQILRLPDSFACAKMEYCLLALRTADDWFVSRSEEPCQGVIGPGKEASLSGVGSRWVQTPAGWVLAVEESRGVTTLEVSESRGERRERSQERQSRYLRLCGTGPSGRPSCTAAIVLSCPKGDGTTSEATWSIAESAVHFESSADPADACEMDGPFMVGDYPLEFP